MSILSSTNTGIRAFKLTIDYLLERGYIPNRDFSRFYYKGKTNRFLDVKYIFIKRDNDTAEGEIEYLMIDFSKKGTYYKVAIHNIFHLEAVEKPFEAKNEKERESLQKKLLKTTGEPLKKTDRKLHKLS